MYSLLWSEHCAYKHSKKLLRTLPTEGPSVVMGPGENAGAVDIGDGLVCAFKVESHNHPSAVEPFQGAATGVGGILQRHLRDRRATDRGARLAALWRDDQPTALGIYSIGLSPASATTATRSAYPRSGARSTSRRPYEQNCLVNAMALGIAQPRAARDERRRRRRQRGAPVRRFHRPRRDRRRVGPRLGRVGRRRRQATDRPGRRSFRGEEADGVLPGAAGARPARLLAGPWRRRPDILGFGDGLQGRGGDRHRRGPGASAGGGHGAV